MTQANRTSCHVVQKGGDPRGPMINRPSIEYTGRGNTLCCFAWNGRFFRSNEEDVREQCRKLVNIANGDEEHDPDYVNINTLMDFWGLFCDDSGERFGWAPDEGWPYPCFTFEWLDKGTSTYDKFGERVFLISIPPEASPYECYWEI